MRDTGLLLRPATHRGDLGAVKELIDSDVNVNSVGKNTKKTALHWAATKGRADMALLLLRSGADRKVADKDGNTPLHLACAKGFNQDSDNMAKTILILLMPSLIAENQFNHPQNLWQKNNKGFAPLTLLTNAIRASDMQSSYVYSYLKSTTLQQKTRGPKVVLFQVPCTAGDGYEHRDDCKAAPAAQ